MVDIFSCLVLLDCGESDLCGLAPLGRCIGGCSDLVMVCGRDADGNSPFRSSSRNCGTPQRSRGGNSVRVIGGCLGLFDLGIRDAVSFREVRSTPLAVVGFAAHVSWNGTGPRLRLLSRGSHSLCETSCDGYVLASDRHVFLWGSGGDGDVRFRTPDSPALISGTGIHRNLIVLSFPLSHHAQSASASFRTSDSARFVVDRFLANGSESDVAIGDFVDVDHIPPHRGCGASLLVTIGSSRSVSLSL